MGRLLDYYRVCPGDILAPGIASYGSEPDGAPGMGNSLVELCSHICDGGIGRTGTIRTGWTLLSVRQCRAAGSDPYYSCRYENEKFARNGSCRNGVDHGFTFLLLAGLEEVKIRNFATCYP